MVDNIMEEEFGKVLSYFKPTIFTLIQTRENCKTLSLKNKPFKVTKK